MSVLEVLLEARRLVELGWTQNVIARDVSGRPVPATSRTACYWCASGAVTRAVRSMVEDAGRAEDLIRMASHAVHPVSVMAWNDARWRTKADVLERFDAEIAWERKHRARLAEGAGS